MDAFDGTSDVDESQATQMLLDLVPDKTSSALSPLTPARHAKTIQSPLTLAVDAAPESFSSRNTNSLPTYHYHGLASTQTQTQSNAEEDPIEEGSQKENIQQVQAAAPSEPLITNAAAKQGQSSKGTPAKSKDIGQSGHSVAYSKARTPNSRPMAIPGLTLNQDAPLRGERNSSRKPYARPPSARQAQRIISPLPSRESSPADSLYRDLSQDHQRNNPPVSKQAGIPIGRVEHTPKQTMGNKLNFVTLPIPGRSTGAFNLGNVLVEATPSVSSGAHSQSQPQEYEETQIIEHHYPVPQPSFPAPEPSHSLSDDWNSSFGRSLMPGASPVATQPVQTQPADDIEMEDTHSAWPPTTTRESGATWRTRTTWQTGPSGATAGPSNPRSLLGGMPAEKRQRYEHLIPSPPPPERSNDWLDTQPVPDLEDTQPLLEDTQPVLEEEHKPVPRPNFTIPRSTRATVGSPPRTTTHRKASAIDAMDIVPDSEPPAHDEYEDEQSEDDEPKPPGSPEIRQTPGKRIGGIAFDDTDDEEEVKQDGKPLSRAAPAPRSPTPPEEEEDTEDDAPLAAKPKAKAKARKGKGVAKAAKVGKKGAATQAKKEPAEKKKPAPKPASKSNDAKGKGKARAARTRANRSYETDIVPSSMPGESPQLPRVKVKAATPVATNRRPTRATKGKQPNYQEPPTDEEEEVDEILPADDLGDLSPLTGGDDVMEVGVYAEPAPDTRKRKRAAAATPAVKQEKKRGGRQITPLPKRTRATLNVDSGNSTATRVVALWSGNNQFYPGTVIEKVDNRHWLVDYDDGETCTVTLDQMRLLQLHPGEEVLVFKRPVACKVVKAAGLGKDSPVTVHMNGEDVKVTMKDVTVAHKTISSSAWDDRTLTVDDIIPAMKAVKHELATPRGTALPDGKKHCLENIGLVITLNHANDYAKEKTALVGTVTSAGGEVISDILTVFNMDGRFDPGGERWIIHKDEVKFAPKEQIKRLFLLADDHSQKPKYLFALALGIPCISVEWLDRCVEAGEEQGWAPFLLPQGYSSGLKIRLSQQVDLDWGNSILHLKQIMDNALPIKLFKGATVLCVGKGMMPQRVNHNRQDPAREGVNALSRIILCMGAETVEAVTKPELASAPLTDYTYIVTRDPGIPSADLPLSRLVDWGWVKNCLLASRLFPLPHAEHLEQSQET
ncbi:hypothetical protein DFP72DRAFT_870613 [Ephemerocybe angulata]|uniref:BRCT domain-containing protein n=1 Tax=Ephemerocybe angulata TaxID=980116 RepID=A0A8H6IGV1_9AGAR|nr:hypothetical protein DFP72DRAFT_870613 [Tulosesus angulatus]